ncbi:MOSC domain-containing protein [Marinitenerispora sediminis]|uniref:MOSC domain-containing protein n=1 Tax=Marinitenerispora sediminis TaxID=1931232 RepID=A0A368T1N1_9ACTN|nr:MOSC domain-containing protein [Marinitenerispora sediminis]RCV50574.1 MOSC domain-containing protein [Marinitenerispora sediminis]RCV54629.1 MOSC domain-containing protein [Marinitenerispora sediminis]RCV54910.1 MOSC domain-containing protein [Marinitenerispora sediminis]
MTTPIVRSVNVGRARDAAWAGRLRRTAIDKRPVEGPVAVRALGLAGDEQADRAHHGGPDQAVYAYAREELDHWERVLGRPLRDGMFGENLTTHGVQVSRAVIGERWRIGTALFEVVLPRVPCAVFAAWVEEPAWVRRFTAEARTGAYLRVLEEGRLAAGDAVTVEHRPDHGIDLAAAFRARHDRDLDLLHRVLELPGRADEWQRMFDKLTARLGRV